MLINNQGKFLITELEQTINANSVISICTNFFTFNALFDLLKSFKQCKSVSILINKDELDRNSQHFVRDLSENETNNKLQTYYRLKKVVEESTNINYKKGTTGGVSFIIIDEKCFQIAPNNITEPTLGIIKDGKPYMIIEVNDTQKGLFNVFDQMWTNAVDCKDEVVELFKNADALRAPEEVYKYAISKIFENKSSDDINEERLVKTGFKSSVVWNKLSNGSVKSNSTSRPYT